MTYIYMTRKDGEWAGIDFTTVETDLWATVDKACPELWNALPPNAELSLEPPSVWLHFSKFDELVEWVEDANLGAYVLAGTLPYDDEDFEHRFHTEDEAIRYAEALWYGLTEDEQDVCKVAVLRRARDGTDSMQVIWSRGL